MAELLTAEIGHASHLAFADRTPVPTYSRNGFPIRTANHPEMIERYAQFVQRTAEEKGTAAAVAAFDSAAAAFPNPPPLVAAT